MLLSDEQLQRMYNKPSRQCDECKGTLHQNYCRSCDEYYDLGHKSTCSQLTDPVWKSDHRGHRVY